MSYLSLKEHVRKETSKSFTTANTRGSLYYWSAYVSAIYRRVGQNKMFHQLST